VSEWSEWFVYSPDGPPIGPLSTKDIAEAILTGKLPPDVWVAAPNVPLTQARWLRARAVPVIAQLLEGVPTRRHRESGMQMISPAPPGVDEDPDITKLISTPRRDYAKFDETLKSEPRGAGGGTALLPPISKPETEPEPVIVLDSTDEPQIAPVTERSYPELGGNERRGPDGFPLPHFPLPPSPLTPTPPPTPTPSPPSYYRGGETLESPGQERPPKRRTSSA